MQKNTGAFLEQLAKDTKAALTSPHIRIFIAEEPQATAALARADILASDPIFRLRTNPRCGYVDQLYVRPKFRKMGIGTKLLRECENWFREAGLEHCVLHASTKAIDFYSNANYKPNHEMFKRL